MTALATIVKKEVRQQVRGFRFLAVSGITLALTALAGFVGMDDFRQRWSSYQEQKQLNKNELATISVYSYLQPVVARAPEPLSVFDRGFEGRLDSDVRISLYTVPALVTSGHEVAVRAPELDLTMIVRLVLGLLALLLTFDAVIGEKETGLLQQIFANDLRRTTLIFGKLLGALVTVSIPLVAGFLLTLWILFERAPPEILAGLQWPRIAGLLAAYGAYLSAMLLVGLVLSLIARSSSGALVLSLIAWLAIVFLIPQAATSVATVFGHSGHPPVESEVRELEAERDRKLTEILKEDRFKLATEGTVHWATLHRGGDVGMEKAELRRYGSAKFYDAKAAYHRQETAIARAYAQRIFEVRQAHRDRLAATANLVDWLASPSPAYLLERIAESLAGTSIADHDRFLQDTRDYRTAVLRYLESRRAFSSWRWFTDDTLPRPWVSEILGLSLEAAEKLEFKSLSNRFLIDAELQEKYQQRIKLDDGDFARLLDLDDLPPFERQPPDLAPAVQRIVPEAAGLLIFQLVLFGTVIWGFSRYDVLTEPRTSSRRTKTGELTARPAPPPPVVIDPALR